MKYRMSLCLVVVLALVVGGVYALADFKGSGGEVGLADFRVQNMTCGSCVKNIQKALADVRGVGEVEVSVTSGRAKVQYDPARIEASSIADRITEAGYPSEVAYLLSPAELQALKDDESRLAANFVARIGERLISREDFDKEVRLRRGNMAGSSGGQVKTDLYRVVWQELVGKELLLAAAERNSVVVQDGEVDLEYQKMRDKTEGFDALVAARYGSGEAFKQLLKEKLIINRNIDEHVLKGEYDSTLRQLKLDRWHSDLVANTPVTIFDPALKAAVEGGGSGCGGSCCG